MVQVVSCDSTGKFLQNPAIEEFSSDRKMLSFSNDNKALGICKPKTKTCRSWLRRLSTNTTLLLRTQKQVANPRVLTCLTQTNEKRKLVTTLSKS